MSEDLLERYLRAVMEPVRDAMIENGDITVAGVRRMDRALNRSEAETYGEAESEAGE